jgi:hypothetical protein
MDRQKPKRYRLGIVWINLDPNTAVHFLKQYMQHRKPNKGVLNPFKHPKSFSER